MQTSRDGIIENFDRGNAEGAALDRQTDQSRAAGAHLFGRGASVRRLAGKSLRLLSTILVVLRNIVLTSRDSPTRNSNGLSKSWRRPNSLTRRSGVPLLGRNSSDDDLQAPAAGVGDHLRHLRPLIAGIGADALDETNAAPRGAVGEHHRGPARRQSGPRRLLCFVGLPQTLCANQELASRQSTGRSQSTGGRR